MFVNCFFLGSEDVRNTLLLLCLLLSYYCCFYSMEKKGRVVDILTLENEYVKNIGINKNKVKLEYYLTL